MHNSLEYSYIHLIGIICSQLMYAVAYGECCLLCSLLVLGMEHYGSNEWQEIQRNVLPTKTLKQVSYLIMHVCILESHLSVYMCNCLQLKLRVKNRCSKRSGSNVIKVNLYVAIMYIYPSSQACLYI